MDIDLLLTDLSTQLPDTVEACHGVIKDLSYIVKELCQRVDTLGKANQLVRLENQQLKERLNLDSHNSSKSPSSDFKKKKRKHNTHKPSGKTSGGQPGHKGHHRALKSLSEVDEVVTCAVEMACEVCGEAAIEKTGTHQRHQVYELPPLRLLLTEYQLEQGCCGHCNHRQLAELPAGVTWGITGPQLTSFMSSLVGDYQLSRREVQRFLRAHFNFKISLGTVFNKQRLVNAALEKPVNDVLAVVKSSHVNMDETSHRRDGKRHWLWGMVSAQAAYFEVTPSRGKKVVKRLLAGFQQVLTTDRYAAYGYLDSSQRQLCWAHLKRDFTRFSERKDPVINRIGKELLTHESHLFTLWHAFKEGHIQRDALNRRASSLKKAVGEALEKGRYTAPELRLSRFCNNLLNDFHALWTFLEVEGVEPTNNHGERALRPAVIWRKKYFSTRSDYGTEFVARTASVKTTCRLQSKSLFDYLTQAVTHYFLGIPAPPLVTT